MPEISGIIENVSHIFYLSGDSKCFFVQVDQDFVMIRLNGVRTADLDPLLVEIQTQPHLFYGQRVLFQKLCKNRLKLDDFNYKVFVFTSKSSLKISSNPGLDQGEKKCSLVTYEGIVTNDKCVQAGIFTLDNKVIVIMSTLCVITNVNSVKIGQKILVKNAHLKKFSDKIGLILCAKGRIVNLTQFSSFHIHKKMHKMFENNVIIQHCLNLKLSAKQLFAFYNALDFLESHDIGFDAKTKYLTRSMEFPQKIFDFLDYNLDQVKFLI